jgi:hypothetical protein
MWHTLSCFLYFSDLSLKDFCTHTALLTFQRDCNLCQRVCAYRCVCSGGTDDLDDSIFDPPFRILFSLNRLLPCMRAQVQGFMRRLCKTIGVRHLPEKNKKPTLFLRECLRIEIYQLLFSTLISTHSNVWKTRCTETRKPTHTCAERHSAGFLPPYSALFVTPHILVGLCILIELG